MTEAKNSLSMCNNTELNNNTMYLVRAICIIGFIMQQFREISHEICSQCANLNTFYWFYNRFIYIQAEFDFCKNNFRHEKSLKASNAIAPFLDATKTQQFSQYSEDKNVFFGDLTQFTSENNRPAYTVTVSFYSDLANLIVSECSNASIYM